MHIYTLYLKVSSRFIVTENAWDAWVREFLDILDGLSAWVASISEFLDMLHGLESREMFSGMFAVVHKGRQTAKRVKGLETL